jgi:hypothetical protein
MFLEKKREWLITVNFFGGAWIDKLWQDDMLLLLLIANPYAIINCNTDISYQV